MLYANRGSLEFEYHASCASEAYKLRAAAEATNAILTLTQANVLKLSMDAMPEAAVFLAETAFEAYGWPSDDLDAAWLDDAGRVTFAVFQAYRKGGV